MSDTCVKHIENYWKSKTETSNEAFNNKKYKTALAGYNQALYRAEVLNNNFSDCIRVGIPFLQVYIISCNNIATTYEELQHYQEAENVLRKIVFYLLQIEANKVLNPTETQRELRKATLAYESFIQRNNMEKSHHKNLLNELKKRFITKQ